MGLLLVVVIIGGSLLAIAIIRATIIQRFAPAPRLSGLYEAAPALLTDAERSFFGVLRQALPPDTPSLPKCVWPTSLRLPMHCSGHNVTLLLIEFAPSILILCFVTRERFELSRCWSWMTARTL
jgi:hypothetical protein